MWISFASLPAKNTITCLIHAVMNSIKCSSYMLSVTYAKHIALQQENANFFDSLMHLHI